MSLSPILKKAKNFEEYREFWNEVQSAAFLTEFPLHLDIELTSICNLKCKMCWQANDPDKIEFGMMSEILFKKIIDEGVKNGLCAIKLQSRGEAMMHPKIFEFSKYAKDQGVIDIHLTTNGTLFLKQDKIQDLFKSGIDKLIFSYDEGHEESIKEIYKNKKKIPNIINIFNKISEIKNEKKMKKPLLVVQTFLSDNEKKEEKIKEINQLFKNVDNINLNQLWNSMPLEESLPGLKKNYEFHPCSYLWSRMLVFWNGNVVPCCRDYEDKFFKIGNANNDTIKDIWLSKEFMKLREMHLKGSRIQIPICHNCDISTKKICNKIS